MNKLYALSALAAIALAMAQARAADAAQAPDLPLSGRLILAQQSNAPKGDASAQEMDKRMQQMQEHMKQMQAQMEKLQRTKDPKERQKLMDEHTKTMHEHISMMRDLGGCLMVGPMARGGDPAGAGGMGCKTKEADSSRSKELMEHRMDMMQMMMEQMIQHQEAMHPKQP